MRLRNCIVLSLFLGRHLVFAGDVSYDETTRITGGSAVSMMKFASVFSKDARKLDQPITTRISVQGNRMARISQDHAEITDLDAETITHIDKLKREYSVVTFAQMREAMEQALEKAKSETKANQAGTDQTSSKKPNENVELSFAAHARQTGAIKQISGIDTSEVILTLAMNGKDKGSGQEAAFGVTNDMWMASDLPGYEEVRDFDSKFAKKIGSVMSGGPDFSKLTQQVVASDAMKALGKEMSQVKGVPVLQVMRMGMTANGQPIPAASEVPLPANSSTGGHSETGNTVGSEVAKSGANAAQQTAAQETASRVRGALGSNLGSAIGGFGGFGGFGKKKKKDSGQDSPTTSTPGATSGSSDSTATASSAAQTQAAGVLLESTTEIGKFSREVDPAALQVPAGYKQIAAPELKSSR